MIKLFIMSAMAFAQNEAVQTATQQSPPMWMQFVPFGIIVLVFYFFLLRPQAQKQKEAQNFLGSLKVGDQVITNSGILGRIAGMNDQVVTLEVANNVSIKILKAQVLMPQSALQGKKEGK